MFRRTIGYFTTLAFAAPATAWAHTGSVPHVHPLEAPVVIGILLALLAAGTMVLGRNRRSA